MRLSVTERENFRKAVKNMISQMAKSDIVVHLTKQGIARITIYNTINRIQNGGPTKDNKLEKRSFQRRCWFGLSKPLFRRSKSVAINSSIYIDECLNKRLLPFIHEHHQDLDYIFWPDLASAHYSMESTTRMNENVNYVTKDINPPNVPQARPIENFWGCLSEKVYEGGWQASTEQQLINRISFKLKEFDLNFVKSLMAGVKAKLRKIGHDGVFSLFKNHNSIKK